MAYRGRLTILVALLLSGTASAQTVAVPEGVGVADRDRPDFHPVGGRIGSFFLYPTFGVSVDATDNVRAVPDDRTEDVSLLISGKAKLQSIFSRHALNAQVFADRSFYANAVSENATRYGGQIDGVYDIAHDAKVSAALFAEHSVEPRTSYTSPVGAVRPGRFDRLSATLSAQKGFGRWTVVGGFAYRTVSYDAIELTNGAVADQRFRDARVYTGTAQLSYQVRPGVSVIAKATAIKTNYTLAPDDPLQPGKLDRDSKGLRIEGGLRFEITSLLYGEVRGGYFKRNFVDPALLDASGPSFGADLLWNVTPLTSVRLEADRRVDEASSTTIAAIRTTEFALSVDHELRRNIILSADARTRRIKPLGPVDPSKEFYVGAGARLLAARWLTLNGSYRHSQRTSPVIGRSYRENRGSLSAVLTF